MDRDLELAKRLAEAVDRAGGRVYFVGGLVRDRLLGRENKDIDVEVHGVTPEALTQILETLGEPVAKGASFGVMGLRHSELDIAMPRRERATGRGHKDFTVFVDPFLGEEKAAMRRDVTINAMDAIGFPVVERIDSRRFASISIDVAKCNACGMCAMFCPTGALKRDETDDVSSDIQQLEFTACECVQCGLCRDVCWKGALSVSSEVPADQLFDFDPVVFDLRKASRPKMIGLGRR